MVGPTNPKQLMEIFDFHTPVIPQRSRGSRDSNHFSITIIKVAKERILVENRPIPTPQGSEILVKNGAPAVNPADWTVQEHGYFVTRYPNVLG